jgi:hypothetical protein
MSCIDAAIEQISYSRIREVEGGLVTARAGRLASAEARAIDARATHVQGVGDLSLGEPKNVMQEQAGSMALDST